MRTGDLLTEHFRLTDVQKAALGKLGIKTIYDVLYHFPARYEAGGDSAHIDGLVGGREVAIVGTLEKLEAKKGWKSRIPMTEGYLVDGTGKIKLRWFNQPYIAKMYSNGSLVRAVGKVTGSEGKFYIANPQLQKISAAEAGLFASPQKAPAKWRDEHNPNSLLQDFTAPTQEAGRPDHFSQDCSATPDLFAVYPESRGITSLWFRSVIKKIFDQVGSALPFIEDPIPSPLLKTYHLPTLGTALVWVHQPHEHKQAEAARKRFAFEEVFLIQLERQQERLLQAREKSFSIEAPPTTITAFIKQFPFEPTTAQQKAIEAILSDMRGGHPMSRLLEGDVGSGKTAVAATAAYAVVQTRPPLQDFGTLQVAYMAPTELLAKQHFESFITFFEQFPTTIGLITGSGCFKFPSKLLKGRPTPISRAQLLKWVANGEIAILIGTHALIEKTVQFKHLALVIIDEQHRFGTNQRRKLVKKDIQLPHLLSMTATPIPRTLALTIYGDLDLTLLDEMPPGRKKIITEIVRPSERSRAYEYMRKELQSGRQAYVICPRIDEPDPEKAFALQAKSVTAEAKRLQKDVFPEYAIAILHSKMTPKEKDEAMGRFTRHEVDILVATSVVEVGVNVPNATIIFIEGAERFGLSQLHQLRGRVIRSNHQAYCFVVPESRSEPTTARLKALVTAKNGFELAEQDLMQRGPGELSGRKQWGISDIGMEALKNLKLVEAARAEALALVRNDVTLSAHPLLKEVVAKRSATTHFE